MTQHGFAVVGAGLWGSQHARVLKTLPEARFVAVCDTDGARAEAMRMQYGAERAYTDLGEMLANPDITAVTVATPDFAHSAIILATLQTCDERKAPRDQPRGDRTCRGGGRRL